MESFRQTAFLAAELDFFCVGGEDPAMLHVSQRAIPPCLKELSFLSYLVVLQQHIKRVANTWTYFKSSAILLAFLKA